MKKISRICFITLVFMSATLPSYSGTSTPSPSLCPNNIDCGPKFYLDPDSCLCQSCTSGHFCTGDNKETPCPVDGQTSPEGSDSEDDCVFNCTTISNDEEKCKGTGFCGYYKYGGTSKYCINCISVGPNVNLCNKYAGCYWDTVQNVCTPCPRGYYCESSTSNIAEAQVACEDGQTSQQASYSKDDCYIDCESYNVYKNNTNFAQGMCKAAPGCYWNEDTDSCEYCPEGYYCDNTETYGLQKQKCPFNSTSDPKSTKKSDCYLGSSNKICDGSNVCYYLGSKEKIYYWQTYKEYWDSVRVTKPAEFPKKDFCLQDDPLPCK